MSNKPKQFGPNAVTPNKGVSRAFHYVDFALCNARMLEEKLRKLI